MEAFRRNFFNGADIADRKMSLIGWKKILALKKNEGLGNRAHLLKWVWHFISNGSFLWSRFIKAIYGVRGAIDIIADFSLTHLFPDALLSWNRIRVPPRIGIEEDHLRLLGDIISSIGLSYSNDRWIWRLDSSGDFSVKSAHCSIEDSFLPKEEVSIRRIDSIPIKLMCKVARWWEVEIHDINSYGDWLFWFSNLRFSKRLNRCKSLSIDWNAWIKNPSSISL
ncbi:hypothetical protein Tco_1208785 [Tanacetum coccineum]